MNRYVIALNRLRIVEDQVTTNENLEEKLTITEVAKLMDRVRKYPEHKIEHQKLFTCGFALN